MESGDRNKEHEEVLDLGSSSAGESVDLIVNGGRIKASKSILSIASPVFRAMFEGNFLEKEAKEVPLIGKNIDDMKELLLCIYPNVRARITAQHAARILPLADEYEMISVLNECEEFYISEMNRSPSDEAVYLCLQKALVYNLPKLNKKCIELATQRGHNAYQEFGNFLPLEIKNSLLSNFCKKYSHDIDILKAVPNVVCAYDGSLDWILHPPHLPVNVYRANASFGVGANFLSSALYDTKELDITGELKLSICVSINSVLDKIFADFRLLNGKGSIKVQGRASITQVEASNFNPIANEFENTLDESKRFHIEVDTSKTKNVELTKKDSHYTEVLVTVYMLIRVK